MLSKRAVGAFWLMSQAEIGRRIGGDHHLVVAHDTVEIEAAQRLLEGLRPG